MPAAIRYLWGNPRRGWRQGLAISIVICVVCRISLAEEEPSIDDARAAQLYEHALELRGKRDATNRELRRAFDMLQEAAGVVIDERSTIGGATETEGFVAEEGGGWREEDPEAAGIAFSNTTHVGALKELVDIYETGDGVPLDPLKAYHLVRRAATLGDPGAQSDVGFRMALGLRPPPRTRSPALFTLGMPAPADALLNYYFAAGGNDTYAQMVLGYRHMYGLGVPRSCQAAVLYYNPVAEQIIELARQPGILPQVEWIRLDSHAARRTHPSREQEVLHFQWFADLGNPDAQRRVGQLLSQGGEHDPQQALRYFMQAAEGGDFKAMAHLGHMHANGAGVEADNATALKWFRAAAEKGHPSALYGLGYMHLAGYGVPKDHTKAFQYFTQAGHGGSVEAVFHLGVMYLNGWGVKTNAQMAQHYLQLAAKAKHLLAMYNLAMMHLSSSDKGQCTKAVELLKQVAERGPMHNLITDGFAEFEEGNYETALMLYLRAAEAGFELGQSNAAWMLLNGYGLDSAGAAPLAHRLHQRAAGQGNVAALLKLGDSAWYGRGAPRDWQRAAQLYAYAAKLSDAQASFNLGFMHQFGAGLPQDLALAKRYYDKAIELQPDAWLPVSLALYGLGLHTWWLEVRPHLPSWGDALWDRIFVVRDNGPTAAPLEPAEVGSTAKFGLGLGWLERVVDRLWAGDVRESQPASSWDNIETYLLVAMCGGLWLILWRRRSIRRQAWQPVAQGPGPPGAAGPTRPVPHDAQGPMGAQPAGPVGVRRRVASSGNPGAPGGVGAAGEPQQ